MQKTLLLVRDEDSMILGVMVQDDPDVGPILPQHLPPDGMSLRDPPEPFSREGRRDTEMAYLIEGAIVWADTSSIAQMKADKNAEINAARLAANLSYFTHQGKQIACDTLSRSDIDAVNGYIAINGDYMPGWPGGWKTMDNTYLSLTTIDDWKQFYLAMVSQGQSNFAKAQSLKARLVSASTAEEVQAISWD